MPKIQLALSILAVSILGLSAGLYEVDRKVRELKAEHLAQVRIERKRTLSGLESLETLWANPPKHISLMVGRQKLKAIENLPRPSQELEEIRKKFPATNGALPFPRYFILDNKPVAFHPFQGAINIISLTGADTPESTDLALKVLEKAQPYRTETTCPATSERMVFFTYPFDFFLDGKIKYPAGWVSAFTQGFWLMALSELHRVTNESSYLDLAKGVLASLTCFRSEKSTENTWVSFIDENSYLWFEEYPKGEKYSTRVLNGHIWVLRALYYWKLHNPKDRNADALLRAGIATVERYGHHYRNPGGPNLYDLELLLNDYSFGRTLDDQEWLFKVTGNSYFQKMRELFRQDSEFR